MSIYLYILWIPLLPLATFVLLGLFGRKYFTKTAGIIGTVVDIRCRDGRIARRIQLNGDVFG